MIEKKRAGGEFLPIRGVARGKDGEKEGEIRLKLPSLHIEV
jgi:hypothetical protein